MRERNQQYVAHRHPNRSSVERIGACPTEDHRVHTQACRVTEYAADVLVVVHTFEHRDGARVGQDVRQRKGFGAARHGEHTTIEVEAHHLGHHVCVSAKERHPADRRIGECLTEFTQPLVHAEECVRREPRSDHPLCHEHTLRDDQTPSGASSGEDREIRPPVDRVEVAEVVHVWVVGVVYVDDRHREVRHRSCLVSVRSDHPTSLPDGRYGRLNG